MTNSSIHTNVMRRVRTIHTLRPLTSMTAFSVALLVLALWGIGREVWVAQVFANMPSVADVAAFTRFVASAFLHTDAIVKTLTVLAAGAGIMVIADAVQNLRGSLRFA